MLIALDGLWFWVFLEIVNGKDANVGDSCSWQHVPELLMLNRSRSRPLEPSDCEIFATT